MKAIGNFLLKCLLNVLVAILGLAALGIFIVSLAGLSLVGFLVVTVAAIIFAVVYLFFGRS